jgi:hypothetical protein
MQVRVDVRLWTDRSDKEPYPVVAFGIKGVGSSRYYFCYCYLCPGFVQFIWGRSYSRGIQINFNQKSGPSRLKIFLFRKDKTIRIWDACCDSAIVRLLFSLEVGLWGHQPVSVPPLKRLNRVTGFYEIWHGRYACRGQPNQWLLQSVITIRRTQELMR